MALYHKYRPQKFADIIGQDHIKQTIMNQVRMGKVAHAYLFFGPRGVGKTTLARLLAKAVNCPKEKGSDVEPDNTNTSAIEISESRSLDVIEIDAASHTGVDHVREHIIDNAKFRPTSLPYKVFIIDEVHMLSTSAFNALLKTLEEPPAHVIFILATTELHKLPDTIISRCQRFTFHKIDYATLKGHLSHIAKEEGVKIDDDVLDRIVNKSDGCARDGISILDQVIATGEKHITAEIASLVLPTSYVEETLDFVSSLIEKDTKKGLDLIFSNAEKGIDIYQLAYDTIELLRAMMVMSISDSNQNFGIDLSEGSKKKLKELSGSVEAKQLVTLIDIVMKRYAEMKFAPIPQLPLEMAVVEWSGLGSIEHVEHNKSNEVISVNKSSSSAPSPTQTPKQTFVAKEVVPPVPSPIEAKNLEPTAKESKKVAEMNEEIEKISIVEEVEEKKIPSGPAVCDIDDAKRSWNICAKAIEQESPSLAFILKMTEVIDIIGDTLKLSVQYSFHQDKLMDIQCKMRLEEHLSKAAGVKLFIDVIVKSSDKPVSFGNPTKNVNDLAAAFGGQVVG